MPIIIITATHAYEMHMKSYRIHIEIPPNKRWPLITNNIWPIENVRRLDTFLPPSEISVDMLYCWEIGLVGPGP